MLCGEVGAATLLGLLAALRADPAWLVLEPLERGGERLFQVVYRPTGTPYGFPATRGSADTWRFARTAGWLDASVAGSLADERDGGSACAWRGR